MPLHPHPAGVRPPCSMQAELAVTIFCFQGIKIFFILDRYVYGCITYLTERVTT
jgi:hypothetical protein